MGNKKNYIKQKNVVFVKMEDGDEPLNRKNVIYGYNKWIKEHGGDKVLPTTIQLALSTVIFVGIGKDEKTIEFQFNKLVERLNLKGRIDVKDFQTREITKDN